MKITIERVANGYIIRDEGEEETWVIANINEVSAALEMLDEVNVRIGHPGDRYSEERVTVIARPGDKWLPRHEGDCAHPWINLSREDAPLWRCPCGAEFALVKPGDSFEADGEL